MVRYVDIKALELSLVFVLVMPVFLFIVFQNENVLMFSFSHYKNNSVIRNSNNKNSNKLRKNYQQVLPSEIP
jgi:hypothetical protein